MKAAKKGSKEPIMKGVNVSDAGPTDVYAGGSSKVVKAAKARKKGGKVMGDKAAKRLDRPCRKSGGKVGANERPLSTAHATSNRPGGDVESENN